jgi:hypothetical protein
MGFDTCVGSYFELSVNVPPGTNLSRQHFTPNNIANGQVEHLVASQWISLLHYDLIKLQLDDDRVASFRVDFSQIQLDETCIPSSEYQTPMDLTNSRRPVSVISETPAADRFGLHDRDEIIPDSETESGELQSESSASGRKRKSEDILFEEKPVKKLKSSTSSPETSKKPRGRPKKIIGNLNASPISVAEATPTPTPEPPNTSTASSQTPKATRSKRKLVVVFSGSTHVERTTTKAFLKKHIQITEDVSSNIDFLCVGNGKLKTTPKVLKAVALGKSIIDDKWVTECLKARSVVDHLKFLASDPETEKEFKVPSTWSAGSVDISHLFQGKTIYATPALRKQYGEGWKSLSSVLLSVGAKKPVTYPSMDVRNGDHDLIVLGLNYNDKDAYELFTGGFQVWNKDLISYGILRGKVDFKSKEFRHRVNDPDKKKTVPK